LRLVYKISNPQEVWNIGETIIFYKGHAKIDIQRLFIGNQNGLSNTVVLKIQMVGICFGVSSIHRFVCLKIIKILIFWIISRFLRLIVFKQFWANLGKFCHIVSG
jgi:hypothetical protein